MTLKPSEIVGHKLPRKLFGVDPEKLQTFLSKIAATLQKTDDELARAIFDRGGLQQSLKKATDRIAELERQIADMQNKTPAPAIGTSKTAETQALEEIAMAKASAEELLQATRKWAAETLHTAETQAQEKIAMAKAAAETIRTAQTEAEETIAGVRGAAEEILQAARTGAEETLKAAKAQAEDTIAMAKTSAEEILQAIRERAAETLQTAETQAQEKITMAKASAETIRTAQAEAEETIAGVKAVAEGILQVARTSAEETLRAAKAQAYETIGMAKTSAEEILQASRKSAAEIAPKVESLVREIQNETLPRLTGLLRQLKQQDTIPRPEAPPSAPRPVAEESTKLQPGPRPGEKPIASRPPVEATAPRVRTVGIVDFYAPIPLGGFEGAILERFAADTIADLLTRAAGAKFAIIPRAVIQQAEAALHWRDEDVLGSERLSTLARTVGADWLIVGLIPNLNVESRDIHGRFTGEASVVVRVFDATQGRIVAETRHWGSKVGDVRPLLAEQVLHGALESTVPSVISTLAAQTS